MKEEGDALNYARWFRNQFYGSKIEFKVENGEFNLLIEQLNYIFDKLGINDEILQLKNEILNSSIALIETI